jgi:hypothetical protein
MRVVRLARREALHECPPIQPVGESQMASARRVATCTSAQRLVLKVAKYPLYRAAHWLNLSRAKSVVFVSRSNARMAVATPSR